VQGGHAGPRFLRRTSNSTGLDRPAAAPRRPTSIRDRIHSRHSARRSSAPRSGGGGRGGALQRMAAPPRPPRGGCLGY
jgi:hypothetical protein